jgi:hypothetical protein
VVRAGFIRGMERRFDEGESMDIHSVASFFVSRVDTEVDKRLEELDNTELRKRLEDTRYGDIVGSPPENWTDICRFGLIVIALSSSVLMSSHDSSCTNPT